MAAGFIDPCRTDLTKQGPNDVNGAARIIADPIPFIVTNSGL
jgi:hypothetical protein